MKIFSITFQSLSKPERLAMYSAVANTIEEAYTVGMQKLISEQGDLMWRPIMQIILNLDIKSDIPLEDSHKISEMTEVMTETSSWIMKTIIDNKDISLYDSSKKYLSKPEQLFIEEKIQKHV